MSEVRLEKMCLWAVFTSLFVWGPPYVDDGLPGHDKESSPKSLSHPVLLAPNYLEVISHVFFYLLSQAASFRAKGDFW